MTAPGPTARIGLLLHPRHDVSAVVDQVVGWAQGHGVQVLVRTEDAGRCPPGVLAVPAADVARGVQALVSLGGDGTMLGALRLAAAAPVPVLGVNLGRVGFLVEVEPSELTAALDQIERADFDIEEHAALVLTLAGEEHVTFNDVALARVPGDGPVGVAMSVDGRGMGHCRCDALIVATPLGSTAYSYAAGGPVVSPRLAAMTISPVAPMSGISRPVVLSAEESLELSVAEDSGRPAVEVDGRVLRLAEPGEPMHVRLRQRAGLVIRLDASRYQRRTQVKLSLLDLPFLPDEMHDLAPDSTGRHHVK